MLAACGFEPVYAPGGSAHGLRNRVEVNEPTTTDTYLLVQNLEEQLGRPNPPEYNLTVGLVTFEQGQAITADNAILRYSIVGLVDYRLVQSSTGAVLASGQLRNFTGYSATGSTVETLASERDAKRRLMTILADQLTSTLYATVDLAG
ncbi:MAG: hypothetical protein AAF408_05375 [Pseudomonadota bacterium]